MNFTYIHVRATYIGMWQAHTHTHTCTNLYKYQRILLQQQQRIHVNMYIGLSMCV